MKTFSLKTCYGVEFKFCGYYHRFGIYRKLNNYWRLLTRARGWETFMVKILWFAYANKTEQEAAHE